jgi:multidrug efflux pump
VLLLAGLRTGLVVALSIPLVLGVTFFGMRLFDVGLHKISLGALILALGLLVDDAIIAVEMMLVKMEQGWERSRAAAFAYTSTAGPMLAGTLVTVAGFLPIATAQSSTGEYTRSIFQVNAIALLASWLAAVIVVPYLGYVLLPDPRARRKQAGSPRTFRASSVSRTASGWATRTSKAMRTRSSARLSTTASAAGGRLRGRRWGVIGTRWRSSRRRWLVFGLVQQQFFPNSTRLELLVDLRLPEGSSLRATQAEVKRLEAVLDKEEGIANYVAYVGTGSPRFYLPLDQQLPAPNFAQFVILTDGMAGAGGLARADDRPVRATISRICAPTSPPGKRPAGGLSGAVPGERAGHPDGAPYAAEVAEAMRTNPHPVGCAARLGRAIQGAAGRRGSAQGAPARPHHPGRGQLPQHLPARPRATSYREGIESIDVVLRGDALERDKLSLVPSCRSRPVPASRCRWRRWPPSSYAFEQGLVWRRNREPTITGAGQIYDGTHPGAHRHGPGLAAAGTDPGAACRPATASRPAARWRRAPRASGSVNAGFPLFLAVVLTVLMVQLGSFSRTAMVVLTAPLGLIGVVLFLLLFNQPFGFVAMLGTIALFGMIMRNSVILVDQIEQDVEKGLSIWEAIVESAVRRLRPIALTAAAAVLAMIPLTRSTFFGPMAVAIMGGLIVATLLTLLFVPASMPPGTG